MKIDFRKLVGILSAFSLVMQLCCYAAPLELNGGYFTGKDYQYKDTGSQNGFKRVIFANNIEYSSLEGIEYCRYKSDDAYITMDSGKYSTLTFSCSKEQSQEDKVYSLDVYVDSKYFCTMEDFDKSPGEAFQYTIHCGKAKSVRLQLISKRGTPQVIKDANLFFVITPVFGD